MHYFRLGMLILCLGAALFWAGLTQNKSVETPAKTAGTEPAAVVEMTNSLRFTPDTVTVQAGETVLWKNTSLLVHSVTGDPSKETKDISASLPKGAEPFDSGLMDPETEFSHTFTVPGTYNYFCIPHEAAMRGVVIVKE